MQPVPTVGDRLLRGDGVKFTIEKVGTWDGAERFRAGRGMGGGKVEQIEGVTLGLVWDEGGQTWRYSADGPPR
jgi:hypothetical protein